MRNKKLSLRTKLGFGIGDWGGNLYFTLIGFFLLNYLTDTALLGPLLAGIAVAIGKIWDAVTDPVVGFLSDRTRSRWGRRRPYILAGGITLFLFMILMFTNFHIKDQWLLFAFAAGAACLLSTAYTLVNIPYGALTPELTKDYNERSVLNGFRQGFAVFGTLSAIIINMLIVTGNVTQSKDWNWILFAAVSGGIMLISALILFAAVKEPAVEHKQSEQNIWGDYCSALKNKTFLLALIPWTLNIAGVTVVMASFKYYYQDIFVNEPVFNLSMLILIVCAGAFIPLWIYISKKLDKKHSYNIGILIFAAALILFFLIGSLIGPYWAMVLIFFAGAGFSTQYAMPYAIIPDIVEQDFIKTGVSREGIYYSLWTFLSKVGQGLAFGVSGLVLYLFKYDAATPPDELSNWGIKLLCGPIPAVFFILAVIILWFYPLTKEKYNELIKKN